MFIMIKEGQLTTERIKFQKVNESIGMTTRRNYERSLGGKLINLFSLGV